MTNPDGELTVAERLGRALDRGLLPAGGPAEAAERLIERLERPARIALLGLPGSGKSSILNLLVGSIVVPETLRLPTIVVQYGPSARMVCTLTDGSSKILPGSDLAAVLPLAPALVTLEMDLAALKVISLLEVSAGPMEAEQKRAATWASKRADIVIWCTTSYLPKEQVVWESLPDAVKDNSFMFLTKVDLLGSRQQATAMHDRVELRAGEEFRQILSISAKEARAAVPQGGPVNRELFRDSGATAVIAAIKTRVQSGRRADTDTAELLLARHVEASELVAKRFADPGEAEEAQTAWAPPPEPEEMSPVEAETEQGIDPADAEAQDDWAEPEVEDPQEDVEEDAEEDAAEPFELDVEDDAEESSVEDDIAAAEPEPEEEPEPEPESEPEPDPVAEMPDEVEPAPPAARRRFADRIKRVASDGDSAAAPLVPLRSTWKSKAELDAPPDPVPEPAPRTPEPTRRPRVSTQPAEDEADVARMLASITSAPEIAPAEEPEPVAEPTPVQRERGPRAITPRPPREAPRATPEPATAELAPPEPATPESATPEPTAAEISAPETDEAARPKLFGAARAPSTGLVRGTPLPDLSSLRARPEELAESAEDDAEDDTEYQGADRALEDDLTNADLSEIEDFGTEAPPQEASPPPEVESEPEASVPVPKPAAPAERPRLFGREPPARPAEPAAPPRTEQQPRVTPISRLPASARAAPPVVPAPTVSADDSQFSPRAIMMRERRVDPETAAPRRERPRIAARAVPVAEAPAAPQPDLGADQGLAAEAVRLILARSAELEREIDPDDKVPVDLILDHARETGEQLISLVSRGQSEAMRRINSDLGEVLDLITLMQLEKGHAPADDALTLLLQLRRELETLQAA